MSDVEQFTSRMMSNLDGEKDADIARWKNLYETAVRASAEQLRELARLRSELEQAKEQARRDREYCTSQTGEDVRLVNQVLALTKELEQAKGQVEKAEAALSDTLNMLRAAHMQCGVHHDSNKRVIKARATLDQCRSLPPSSTKRQGDGQ